MKLQNQAVLSVLFIVSSLSLACSTANQNSATNTKTAAVKNSKDNAAANDSVSDAAAKNAVDELITRCAKGDYEEAAKRMINKDKCPKMPDDLSVCAADYSKPDEKPQIERECGRLKQFADTKYTVGAEEVMTQGDKSIYQYEVELETGAKTEKQRWYFVKIGDRYALADID